MDSLNTLDLHVLGSLIRKERRAKGIRTTEEFSKVIFARAGYRVSKGALQRVEAGQQEMPYSLLTAIVITLFDGDWGKILDITKMSYPKDWESVCNGDGTVSIGSFLYDYRRGIPDIQ